MSTTADAAPLKKGHPKGLYVLFFSEAWERFSFYGMRALLVLYLVNQLDYEKNEALGVYGMYLGLVYLTPVLGGYLADRTLGARKAIIIGGILMATGHLAMAFESLLFVGMGLIIAGNGFFKPNISTIVGSLYETGDPRRDGGFTIFYMGINLGAFAAPLVCGYLGENIGWHWGFSAATVGMVIGLFVFVIGRPLLGTAGFPPGREVTPETKLTARDWVDIGIYVLGGMVAVVTVTQLWTLVGPVWNDMHWGAKLGTGSTLIGGSLGLYFYRTRLKREDAERLTWDEWKRVTVIVVICFFVVFFWMGFEQAGGTMTLFADQQTDRTIPFPWGDWLFPASWFQAVNPLFIVAFAPLFSIFWARNDRAKWGLSTPAKMGVGMIILGLGFVVMYFGQAVAEAQGKAGIGWLFVVYYLHTMGELCLSPIGLSMVTKLSPARTVSLMMGLWFAASALADYLSGKVPGVLEAAGIPLWPFLIGSSCGAGFVLLLITPLLKKGIGGRA